MRTTCEKFLNFKYALITERVFLYQKFFTHYRVKDLSLYTFTDVVNSCYVSLNLLLGVYVLQKSAYYFNKNFSLLPRKRLGAIHFY